MTYVKKTLSFAKGEHHVANEMRIPEGFARRVRNFSIDDGGLLIARRRFEKVAIGGHSPFPLPDQRSALFFDGGWLLRFTDTGAVLPVFGESGPFFLPGTGRVWYVLVNDRVYFSNGQGNGMVRSGGLAAVWGKDREAWFVGAPDDTELLPVALEAFPPALYLAHFGGRIYGAVDNLVLMTAPLDYSSYDPRYDYVTLPSEVTAIGSVADGLYLGTTQGVYFYKPDKDASVTKISDTPAIAGSQVYVPYLALGIESIGGAPMADAFCWLTREGLYAGLPGGQLRALTGGVVKLPSGIAPRTSLVQSDGFYQIVSVLDAPVVALEVGVRDTVTVTL